MQLGNLRHRITIQENRYQRDEANLQVRDASGAPVDEWVDVRTCWASMEPLSGREYFAAAQVQAEQVTRFRIRYPRFHIWQGMRVKYLDSVLIAVRYFNIQAVIDPNEMHIEMLLMTTEQIKPLVAEGSESSSSSGVVGNS
jgi:SPP1 family predicted phage head-tail adaptor